MDIETAPNLAYVWGMWEQNVIDFQSQWYILTFSARWKDGEQITKGLVDYPGYSKHKEDDRALVKELWNLFDEAEVIVAHNGDSFDIKKINTRFSYYQMPPPSPYRTVDTKKVAKRYFSFNSNSLDNLGEYLGLGRKIKHEGFELWQGCMAGMKSAWDKMKLYNQQDVILLEKVYLHFLPWIKNHPNMAVYQDITACPKCGSNHLQKKGFALNVSGNKYQRIMCVFCGGWCQSPIVEKREIKPLKNL